MEEVRRPRGHLIGERDPSEPELHVRARAYEERYPTGIGGWIWVVGRTTGRRLRPGGDDSLGDARLGLAEEL